MSGILDAQNAYIKSGFSRFHTPGHSGVAEVLSGFSRILPYDVTEVEAFDSLYHADGIIEECEKTAAEIFGAKDSLLSAGGCTLAIQTMLALAVPRGGKVAMGRNAHRTAVNTLALLDLDPVWIYPENGAVSPSEIEAVLTKEGIDAVYLTSPDYYGRLCDIGAIAKLCHQKKIPLLVDNAHGPHLKFLSSDIHPITLGADMTACSLHKTLPVLTGGALLNIANHGYIGEAKAKMELFGSTSPSYLTMASMDMCFDWLRSSGTAAFAGLAEKVYSLKTYAAALGFFFPEGNTDPVRFTLEVGRNGIDGKTAHDIFLECGAVCEYFDRNFIVFIITPFHEEADFLKLYRGLDKLSALRSDIPLQFPKTVGSLPKNMSVRDAVFAEHQIINIDLAVGRAAAEAVCLCPPGIPVVIPGERMDESAVSLLKYSGIYHIKVVK